MTNMFDNNVYPITDEYNLISDNEVLPEISEEPVSEEPILSITDDIFTEQIEQDEQIPRDFSDNSYNIKFANFANEVYVDKNSRKSLLLNHKYIDNFSNKNLSTYVDKQDKSIVVAVRGTVASDYNDIISDIGIVAGDNEILLQRISEYKKIINKVIEKYPSYNVVLTGHSLGGYLVEELVKHYDTFQGIVFNPATSLSNVNTENPNPNIIGYRTTGDPVSLGYSNVNMKTIRNKFNIDRHSILNFIDRTENNILD
jgi:hypothetical protein